MKNAAAGLVMTGAVAALTVMVSARVDVLPETLVAEIVTGKVPAGPVALPAMVAVPSVPAVKLRPAGRVPDSVIVAAGKPVVVTV